MNVSASRHHREPTTSRRNANKAQCRPGGSPGSTDRRPSRRSAHALRHVAATVGAGRGCAAAAARCGVGRRSHDDFAMPGCGLISGPGPPGSTVSTSARFVLRRQAHLPYAVTATAGLVSSATTNTRPADAPLHRGGGAPTPHCFGSCICRPQCADLLHVDDDIDRNTWDTVVLPWFRGINSVIGVQRTGSTAVSPVGHCRRRTEAHDSSAAAFYRW
jgi:hypothetical protein